MYIYMYMCNIFKINNELLTHSNIDIHGNQYPITLFHNGHT